MRKAINPATSALTKSNMAHTVIVNEGRENIRPCRAASARYRPWLEITACFIVSRVAMVEYLSRVLICQTLAQL